MKMEKLYEILVAYQPHGADLIKLGKDEHAAEKSSASELRLHRISRPQGSSRP
jgi:hypothetical protein